MKRVIILLTITLVALVITATLYFKNNDSFDGYWLSEGYGLVLDIRKGKVTFYEQTGYKLIKDQSIKGHIKGQTLKTPAGDFDIKTIEDGLIINNTLDDPMFHLKPLDSIGEYEILETTQDPNVNFDLFWKTFEENYPFFELYGVNWQDQKNKYSEKIESGDLEELFKEMVGDLNDGHVQIGDEDEYSPYKDEPEWHKNGLSRPFVEIIEYEYIDDFKVSKDRLIRHGHLDDATGYILIASMGGYLHEGQAVENIQRAFENALFDLKDCDNLILDIRFNRGGYDNVGLSIASYFTNEPVHVFKRQVMDKGEASQLNDIFIQSNDKYHDFDNIFLLTSGASVSAAETFGLAMKALDQVVIIGEPTAGFYADMMVRHLPNGMVFSLPHYIYFNAGGSFIEGQGIPVDQTIEMDSKHIELRIDPALDYIKENY